MEIGLLLRKAMLINGIIFNSVAWHAVSDADIKILEKVDELLLSMDTQRLLSNLYT